MAETSGRSDVVRGAMFDPATVSFGVVAVAGDREQIRVLEQLGVESFWVGGHIAGPRPTPEVITSMSWLAATVGRAAVGAAVLQLPLYRPAIVAKQFAEIDRLAPAGTILGVGVGGEHPAEFSATQVPVDERGARADEALQVIRKLWTSENIEHTGPYYPVSAVSIRPRPPTTGGPPIVVAGRMAPAMRRAAWNDGWMPYLYSPDRYRVSVSAIQEQREECGGPYGWMLWVVACIDRNRASAREAVAALQPGGGARALELADKVGIFGDVHEVTERFCEYVDAGVRHFIVAFAGGGRVPQVVAFFTDVVPVVARHVEGGRDGLSVVGS